MKLAQSKKMNFLFYLTLNFGICCIFYELLFCLIKIFSSLCSFFLINFVCLQLSSFGHDDWVMAQQKSTT